MNELPPLVDIAFSCNGTGDLVLKVVRGVAEMAETYEMELYMVVLEEQDENSPIGYVVLLREPKKMMYSFGINREYRKTKIKSQWLKAISSAFHEAHWGTAINKDNKRAINFFLKNGFEIKNEYENHVELWQYQ